MIGQFEHKSYIGIPHVEAVDNVIAGRILGIDAIVTFEGDTVPEVRKAFEESVEDYLAWCASRTKDPEKPFAGSVKLRMPSELHEAVARAADAERTSVVDIIVRTLTQVFVVEGQRAGPTDSVQGRPRVDAPSPVPIHPEPIYGHSVEDPAGPSRSRRTGRKSG